MHPQRRTALVSVLAAAALVVLKLATGIASGSLGLLSEALHSGTDLVAALLTFFAVGVAPDFRYAYWAVLAAIASTTVMLSAPRNADSKTR